MPASKSNIANIAKISAYINQMKSGDISMAYVAREIGVSRERVRQVCLKYHNVTGKSISDKKSAERVACKKEAIKARQIFRHGASEDEIESIFGQEWRSHVRAFSYKKRNVRREFGYEAWDMKLIDWLNIWREQGHLGDCLTRIDCDKPFKAGNLIIMSFPSLIKRARAKEASAKSRFSRDRMFDNRCAPGMPNYA